MEAAWRRLGGGLEAAWRWLGGGLEVAWRRLGGGLEVAWRWLGGGKGKEIGALSRAMPEVSTGAAPPPTRTHARRRAALVHFFVAPSFSIAFS